MTWQNRYFSSLCFDFFTRLLTCQSLPVLRTYITTYFHPRWSNLGFSSSSFPFKFLPYCPFYTYSSPVVGSLCWWQWPDICSSRAHRPRTLSRWSIWWGRAGGCSVLTHSTDMGSGAPPAGKRQTQSIPTAKKGLFIQMDKYMFFCAAAVM